MGKLQPREISGRAAKGFKAEKIADFISLLFRCEVKILFFTFLFGRGSDLNSVIS